MIVVPGLHHIDSEVLTHNGEMCKVYTLTLVMPTREYLDWWLRGCVDYRINITSKQIQIFINNPNQRKDDK